MGLQEDYDQSHLRRVLTFERYKEWRTRDDKHRLSSLHWSHGLAHPIVYIRLRLLMAKLRKRQQTEMHAWPVEFLRRWRERRTIRKTAEHDAATAGL